MAKIFNNKKIISTKIDELIAIANSKGFSENSYLFNYLKRIKDTDLISSFKTEEILYEVIRKVIDCNSTDSSIYIELAKEIFDNVIYDPTDKEQLYLYYKYLDKIFSDENTLKYFSGNIESFKTITSLFNSNSNKFAYDFFVYFCDYIVSSKKDADIVIKYALESRPYYVVDAPFYASLILFANHSLDMHGKDLEKYYEESLKRDERSAGIYNISEEAVAENARKLEKAQRGVDDCITKTGNLEKQVLGISGEVEARIDELVKARTGDINTVLDRAKADFNKSIEEATGSFVSNQGSLISTLDEREKKLKLLAQEVADTGKYYVNEISKRLIAHPELEGSVLFSGSPLFDKKISVKERYERALSLKDPKGIYHESFDLILKYMLINTPVMLVGPSGAGKSYTTDQVGALIGSNVYNFGFVADEYATIKGYMDQGGKYVKTPFYDVFKYGGISFFDEVDNSESKALIELNKIIGGNGFQKYLFPNGDKVNPNPEFNIIAAANTWGDGADPAYPTREIMDRSTINRFAQIYYGFDPKVEQKILAGYDDIYEFCLCYRAALEDRQSNDLISTKDMSKIKEMIEAGIFTWPEIMSKIFIKNRKPGELMAIEGKIRGKVKTSTKIYTEFSKCLKQ